MKLFLLKEKNYSIKDLKGKMPNQNIKKHALKYF